MLNQRKESTTYVPPTRIDQATVWRAVQNILSSIREKNNMGGQEVINTPEPVTDIVAQWENIVANPDEYIASFDGLHFTAGGGLPLQFGNETSQIWQALVKAMDEQQHIEIAGISFSKTELAVMGEFYRWLRDVKQQHLHCIDERLAESPEHHSHEVHDACGACAAAKAAAGVETNFEDVLLSELGQDNKEPIYTDMPNHDSVVIYADLSGQGRAVAADKRAEMKAKHALAFNATLPVESIQEFVVETGADLPLLIVALAKWNVQIARNIIGGHHNESHQHAAETRMVIDKRGVPANVELVTMIELALSKVVDQSKQLVIAE